MASGGRFDGRSLVPGDGVRCSVHSAFRYSLFGLTVESALLLPELVAEPGSAQPDVAIKLGVLQEREAAPEGYSGADATLLNVPRVGCYKVSGGREIVVDPADGASERDVRLFLLGSAFGALLHQRGVVPLHANAIEIEGRAVAFSGHSGAGKSTIAAWFYDRGYRVLADDVCAIRIDEAGQALAYPGIPRLRLWREALEASGRAAENHVRSFGNADKYDVPTRPEAQATEVPLFRVYMLANQEAGGEAPSLRRLAGAESVNALVSNTYRGGYVKSSGRTAEHLMQCVRLARAVEVFEARRVWGFDRFDEQAGMLERHALSR